MLSPSSVRRAGPDACPGALAVHEAADGGLARVRLPGGRLAPAALLALADAADELGSGVLELTSRGNVQVRGLPPPLPPGTAVPAWNGGKAPGAAANERRGAELAARLRAAGLLPSDTHERVRNVVASPLTGLTGGRPDVGPLVAALDRGLCADAALAQLPGRFLFSVDDGSADVSALGADVGLFAVGDEYALLLGGTDSRLRLAPAEAAAGALAAARAFLDARTAQSSPAWRLAELDGGPAAVLHYLDRPGRGDVHSCGQFSRLDGPGREELLVPRAPEPGEHGQDDGRVALVVLVPGGRLDAAAARALAGAGAAELRVTPWRSVVVPGLEPAAAGAAADLLTTHGLVTDPASGLAGVTACAGTPGCAKARADVRAAAAATPAQRAPGRARPLPVHWAACERRCGRPAGRHVEVLAAGGGFEVRRDGRLLGVGDAEHAGAVAAGAR